MYNVYGLKSQQQLTKVSTNYIKGRNSLAGLHDSSVSPIFLSGFRSDSLTEIIKITENVAASLIQINLSLPHRLQKSMFLHLFDGKK